MKAYAITDIGKKRSFNQDYAWMTTDEIGKLPNLFIVADGMGGHRGGGYASRLAVETILNAKKIYVIGIRSCAPLASFLGFYLNLICDNVVAVHTNSSSEIFEQLIRIDEDDVIIGISFPRYSMRTLKALEFASNRKAKVITLTDSVHSPMTLYSSCNLIARSDMASIVDSLVAPLSVVNALVVALCMKKQDEVITTLETLERIWDEYQVYSKDELNMVDDKVELSSSKAQIDGEETYE